MSRELEKIPYLPTTTPIRHWSCILAHAQRLGGIAPSCGAILAVSVASLGLFTHIVMQGFTPMNRILLSQLAQRHENGQCKMLWVLLATTHHPPDSPSIFWTHKRRWGLYDTRYRQPGQFAGKATFCMHTS